MEAIQTHQHEGGAGILVSGIAILPPVAVICSVEANAMGGELLQAIPISSAGKAIHITVPLENPTAWL